MKQKDLIRLSIILICTVYLLGLYYISNKFDSLNPNTSLKPSNTYENSTNFTFEPEVLTYDGQGGLNYLYGVSYKGEDASEKISYTIENTDSLDTKIIIYRIQNEESLETASRTLKLVNYHLPKIIIPDPALYVDKTELDHLYSILDYDKVSVDNGFGQEDKNRLKFEYTWDATDSAQINYSLSYMNMCGDIASASFSTDIDSYTYRIIIKQSKLKIQKYRSFNPREYLVSCTDKNNIDYTKQVEIFEDVDITKTGTYPVIYKMEDVSMKMVVEVN